jgi:hypothetical protein
MKSFSEFMTEAAFLMRKTGENLVTQKNKTGRAGFPGGFGKHEKIEVGGELGSSNPTRHAKAFGGLKKLMRDRVAAKDAVKHISKHVDHKPMNDEIEAIAKDRPDTDVRNVIKHHLRKAGMKNTHLL